MVHRYIYSAPRILLQSDERDEFPSYVSTGGPSGWRKHVTLPATRAELAIALRDRPADDFFYEDNWRELLQKKLPVAIGALLQLAREGTWPNGAWQEALQYLSDEKIVRRAWNRLHRKLSEAPAETIRSLGTAISWWLQSVANAIPLQAEQDFLRLINRILGEGGWEETETESFTLSQSINHPIGHVTEALLRWWYRTGPKVGGLLPLSIRDRFSFLLTTVLTSARHVLRSLHTWRISSSWTRCGHANTCFPTLIGRSIPQLQILFGKRISEIQTSPRS